jgi:serine/threonine protein kinase
LIRIQRVWCAEGFLIIAMDLADGSLGDLLDVSLAEFGAGISFDQLLPLMKLAAKGLDFLNQKTHLIHDQRVTIQHCDITPFNILVLGNGVVLSDFSLTTTLTDRQKSHHRAGTPAFAAPEVFHGCVSDRTDQYSLALCYCWLRGARIPFTDTPPDFDSAYVRPAPDLTMLSPAERPVLARALAVMPEKRWPSCTEMLVALEKAMKPKPGRRSGTHRVR